MCLFLPFFFSTFPTVLFLTPVGSEAEGRQGAKGWGRGSFFACRNIRPSVFHLSRHFHFAASCTELLLFLAVVLLLGVNVGYSGSISFNEKDGGRTDGDKAAPWRRAAPAASRPRGKEIGRRMCNFPRGVKGAHGEVWIPQRTSPCASFPSNPDS